MFNLLKKIIFLNLCLAIFACDSDTSENTPPPIPDPSPTDDSVLLKKTIERFGSEIFTSVYNYDGNKLTSIVSEIDDDYIYEYSFIYDENDFLIRAIYNDYALNEGDSDLQTNTNLEYTNGKLSKITVFEYGFEIEIIHNNNNTLSVTHNEIDSPTSNQLWTFHNENLIEISKTREFELSTTEKVIKYEYDNKNNAFKNIHAIDVFNILSEIEGGPLIYGNTNNYTVFEYLRRDVPENLPIQEEYQGETIEYTYNANGFPIKASTTYKFLINGIVSGSIETGTIEYFYE